MNESGRIVLLRYFNDSDELDVFLNGELICTLVNGSIVAYPLVMVLEKLGFSDIEKQQCKKRWYQIG